MSFQGRIFYINYKQKFAIIRSNSFTDMFNFLKPTDTDKFREGDKVEFTIDYDDYSVEFATSLTLITPNLKSCCYCGDPSCDFDCGTQYCGVCIDKCKCYDLFH